MENKKYDIQELITKWLSGNITPEEKLIVENWYKNFDDDFTVIQQDDIKQRIYKRLENRIFKNKRKRFTGIYYKLSAAAVVIIVALSMYLNYKKPNKQILSQIADKGNQLILPGSNKAILTLADGSNIVLDSTNKSDTIANQGNVIIKNQGGNIVYIGKDTDNVLKINQLNTISTPRGGQYRLTLSDGSRVWLNAASSITYPVRFDGSTRDVRISGEAYFEVIHNVKAPFRVVSDNQIIEDIGTSFDIKNYSNEGVLKTTLVEGSIKIGNMKLKPGQQAVSRHGIIMVVNVDPEDVIAWKNGYFLFDNADIKDIMQQIARWYDVDIVFQGKTPEVQFGGGIARSSTIQQVLSLLSQSNIHFKIQNKKIIVMP